MMFSMDEWDWIHDTCEDDVLFIRMNYIASHEAFGVAK